MSKSSTLNTILSITLAACIISPAMAAPGAFNQAVANYKARKYLKALQGFQQVAKKYPTDAQTQYYMALCYQGMNQVALAKQHYAWVAQSSRNPALRSQAALALSQLDRYAAVRSYTGSAASAPAVEPSKAASTDADKTKTAAAPTDKTKASSRPLKLTGKLKVIQFHTASSPDAAKFAPIWEKVTAQYKDKVEFESLDAEQAQNTELVAQYSVKTYPTLIYTDASGKVLNKEEGGLITETGFVSMLNGLLAAIK